MEILCTTDCWTPLWRPPLSLEKWLIPGMGHRRYKESLEHLIVQKARECSRKNLTHLFSLPFFPPFKTTPKREEPFLRAEKHNYSSLSGNLPRVGKNWWSGLPDAERHYRGKKKPGKLLTVVWGGTTDWNQQESQTYRQFSLQVFSNRSFAKFWGNERGQEQK